MRSMMRHRPALQNAKLWPELFRWAEPGVQLQANKKLKQNRQIMLNTPNTRKTLEILPLFEQSMTNTQLAKKMTSEIETELENTDPDQRDLDDSSSWHCMI